MVSFVSRNSSYVAASEIASQPEASTWILLSLSPDPSRPFESIQETPLTPNPKPFSPAKSALQLGNESRPNETKALPELCHKAATATRFRKGEFKISRL